MRTLNPDQGQPQSLRSAPPAELEEEGAAVTVVIPTFNERENIATVLCAVRGVLPLARLLVVDDASPDGTATAVHEISARDDGVELLPRARREGLGPAYFDGFGRALAAGAQFIVQMDADLSHRPQHLPALLAAARGGADLALGSRYVPGGGTTGWPLSRRLTSRAGSRYAALVLGLPVHDATGGFRCWPRPSRSLSSCATSASRSRWSTGRGCWRPGCARSPSSSPTGVAECPRCAWASPSRPWPASGACASPAGTACCPESTPGDGNRNGRRPLSRKGSSRRPLREPNRHRACVVYPKNRTALPCGPCIARSPVV